MRSREERREHRTARVWFPAIVGVILASLSACAVSPSPTNTASAPVTTPTTRALTWSTLKTPDVVPNALSSDGDGGVLVAGRKPSGSKPAAARIDTAGKVVGLSLDPADGTAAQSTLTGVTSDGKSAYFVGGEPAGESLIAPWTAWDGEKAGSIHSRPAATTLFDQTHADPVLGVVMVDESPVIVASRDESEGPAAAIYTLSDGTWSSGDKTHDKLTSRTASVLHFSAIASRGSRLLIAGDATGSDESSQQTPMLFVGELGGSWQAIVLPVPQGHQAGSVSRATSVSCAENEEVCWVAGWASGSPMVWKVDVSDGSAAIVLDARTLVGDEPDDDPVATVTVAGDTPVVFPNGKSVSSLVGCADGSWSEAAAPPSAVTSATANEHSIYAITKGSSDLSVGTAPSC